MSKESKLYHSIPLDEEQLPLHADGQQQTRRLNIRSQVPFLQNVPPYCVWVLHAVLLALSTTMFVLSFCVRGINLKPTDMTVTEQFSSWSPAADVVRYETVRYNLTPIATSPFVGYGPEVDAQWDYITNDVGDQMISGEEVDRLGLSRDSLKIKHPKTGVEGYRVGIEVFHQLHCLNLLRQFTWKEYYSQQGGDVETDQADLRGHVDHCIETLRMNIMCQADIGVFTFKYYEELEDNWPDFSTLHVCRNFEGIRQWAMDNSVAFGDEA